MLVTGPTGSGKTSAVKPTKIEIVIRPLGEFFEKSQYEVDKRPPVDSSASLREILKELKATKGEII